jgi:tetratricopeptide (TPR) repeat protein
MTFKGDMYMTDVWRKIFEKTHGEVDGHDAINAISVFNEEIYVGTERIKNYSAAPQMSTQVYRLVENGCKKWQSVTPPWIPLNGLRSAGLEFAVFKNCLYAGVYDYQHNDMIWRFTEKSGWSSGMGNLNSKDFNGVAAMIVFNSHLYVCTGRRIYRTLDGTTWEPVVGPNPAVHAEYFGQPSWGSISCLEVLNNFLYAGQGKHPNGGIQIWRTKDGVNWEVFHKVLPDPNKNISVFPDFVEVLHTFNNFLYIACSNSNGLFRTDGSLPPSAYHWEPISSVGSPIGFELKTMVNHDGKLYIGLRRSSSDAQGILLHSSNDGKSWSAVANTPLETLDTYQITSLLSNRNRLYVGIWNRSRVGSIAVWELSHEAVADGYEPNDNFDFATEVNLASSADKTAKITDLTLHSGDVDFFKIDFVSQPHDEFSPFKVGLGGGIILEMNPGYLSISLREEYCDNLFFYVYDANKNFKGIFNKEIVISSPGKTCNGQRLFVAVKHPVGFEPLRYNLSVKQSGWSGSMSRPVFEIDKTMEWPIHLTRFSKFFDKILEKPLNYIDPGDLIKDIKENLPDFIEHKKIIDEAYLQHGLGYIAHQIGQYDMAENFYRTSLGSFQELKIRSSEAEVLRDLGETLSAQKRVDEALDCFMRAVQLHKESEDLLALAKDMGSLGRLQLEMGKVTQSLATLDESLRILATSTEINDKKISLLYQCKVFIALNMKEAAMACLVLAEELFLRIKDPQLWTESDDQIKRLQARIGEESYLSFRKKKGERAEAIRYEAISNVLSTAKG